MSSLISVSGKKYNKYVLPVLLLGLLSPYSAQAQQYTQVMSGEVVVETPLSGHSYNHVQTNEETQNLIIQEQLLGLGQWGMLQGQYGLQGANFPNMLQMGQQIAGYHLGGLPGFHGNFGIPPMPQTGNLLGSNVLSGSSAEAFSDMRISVNGNQVHVVVLPAGSYTLSISHNNMDVGTLENSSGQFTFTAKNGQYQLDARSSNGRTYPGHSKSVTVEHALGCSLKSSIQYGGSPLKSKLTCHHPESDACRITLLKDGVAIRSIDECLTNVVIEDEGIYDAKCEIPGEEGIEDECFALIEVDVMTNAKTGPFLPILIIMALGLGIFITYRQRKAA